MTKFKNLLIAPVLAMVPMFLGLTTAPVEAGTLAGCVSPGGGLKNVALGTQPSKPCGKNDELVVWEEVAPPSACPCDIRAMAGWAGWTGPICFGANSPPEAFFASVGSEDFGLLPFVVVRDDDDATFGGQFCETQNDVSDVIRVDDLDADQLRDCFADLNELAMSLGLADGCSPDDF